MDEIREKPMDVKQCGERLNISHVLRSLLQEFGAASDYSTVRDELPGCLAQALACRGVLIYLVHDEVLRLVSGMFGDQAGWSAELLAAAHMNPIGVQSQVPEARAWREKRPIGVPLSEPTLMAVPLISRYHCIGVLVVVRGGDGESAQYWSDDEIEALEAVAGVVSLLLENTRLRERDRERIHELSLLNSISSQLQCSLHEKERLYSVVIQRTREISAVDVCELLEPASADTSLMAVDEQAWITSALYDTLLCWVREQQGVSPLIVERASPTNDPCATACLALLPGKIETFFAFPLVSVRMLEGGTSVPQPEGMRPARSSEPTVLGVIVGGYYHARKLRPLEQTLLQVLASQVSAVIENMRLMAEVVEARNEARHLLRQVLDDRRIKELILESIPSGLITTDLEGRVQTFNRAAATILGYHPYEVMGQMLHRFLQIPLSNSSSALPEQTWGQGVVESGGQRRALQHARLVFADRFERRRMLDVDTLPLYSDRGACVGTLVTFSDMTSIQHLEEEKLRLHRLAALGEMAAGVAHEVRNPLASIKTSIQMVRNELEEEAPESLDREWMQESMGVMLKEVERLDRIVRDLLLFARPRQPHRVRCNLAELSDQVIELLQRQLAEAHIVVHRVYDELPDAWLDREQIEQIMLNLLTNAMQAMPDGGIITVTCRCIGQERFLSPLSNQWLIPEAATLSIPFVNVSEKQPQQWLELLVNDTGGGIALTHQERLFQPFYTTKAHGIGLGLSITRRLVEDHGGTIRIESQLGYGATVIVRLPVVNGEDGLENREGGRD